MRRIRQSCGSTNKVRTLGPSQTLSCRCSRESIEVTRFGDCRLRPERCWKLERLQREGQVRDCWIVVVVRAPSFLQEISVEQPPTIILEGSGYKIMRAL